MGWRSLLPDRFWAKVRVTDGCWYWEGCTNKHGYGMFWLGRRARLAHRIVYAAFHHTLLPQGRSAQKWQINHKCKNPSCCNPRHLELLSASAHTVKDSSKSYCKRGHNLKSPDAQTTNGKCRKCQKVYYNENKERIDAQYREYYVKNRERINARQRERRRIRAAARRETDA